MTSRFLRTTLTLATAALLSCEGSTAPIAAPGALVIRGAMTGKDLDANGFTVSVAGGPPAVLANGDSLRLDLAPRIYQISIGDVAPNCAVDGSALFNLNVLAGETSRTTVTLVCQRLTPGPTSLELFSLTTGLTDSGSFTVQLDGGAGVPLSSSTYEVFQNLAPGPHLVSLSGLKPNCTTADSSITVTLAAEQVTTVRVDLACHYPLTHDMVFTSSRASPNFFTTQLFYRKSDGTAVTLIGPLGQSQQPDVSPTGARVAYLLVGVLWLMDIDGNNNGSFGTPVSSKAWSPDGQRLAYSATNNGALRLVNADWSGDVQISPAGEIALDPTWSPDGSRLAVSSTVSTSNGTERRIHLINADGSGWTNLNLGQGFERTPVWSPDGTRIAYTSTNNANVTFLRSVAPDGTGDTLLYPSAIYPEPVSWAPDGSRIVFCSLAGNVVVIGADGSNPTIISSGWQSVGCRPQWSPDGSVIGFYGQKNGNAEIYVVRPDGTGLVNATLNAASENQFSWVP